MGEPPRRVHCEVESDATVRQLGIISHQKPGSAERSSEFGGSLDAGVGSREIDRAAATTGCMNAMAAAGYLVKTGVPFRRAHELIGSAVQLCIQRGCELEDLSAEQWKQCGIDLTPELRSSLKLEAVLGCHDVDGGTAPARVRQALARAQERLAAVRGAAHVGA